MVATMSAPDLTCKVTGYRAWNLINGKLRPLNPQWPYWRIGTNQATCQRHDHAAPDPDCVCGLYAWHTPSSLRMPRFGQQVVGAIVAWGKIETHHDGFRAEYAEPVLFGFELSNGETDYRRAYRFARQSGRRLVAMDDLEEYAIAYGQPMPEELRPPLRPPSFTQDLETKMRRAGLSSVQKILVRSAARQAEFNNAAREALGAYLKAKL